MLENNLSSSLVENLPNQSAVRLVRATSLFCSSTTSIYSQRAWIPRLSHSDENRLAINNNHYATSSIQSMCYHHISHTVPKLDIRQNRQNTNSQYLYLTIQEFPSSSLLFFKLYSATESKFYQDAPPQPRRNAIIPK